MRRSAAVLAVALIDAGAQRLRRQQLECDRQQRRARPPSTTASRSRSRSGIRSPAASSAVMNSVIADFHKLYPNITVKSRGGDHRRQHRRGDPRRQPARPDDVAVRRQPRRVLRHRRMDQPRALHRARPRQPRRDADRRPGLHPVQRRPLRAARPRRRLRALLQQGACSRRPASPRRRRRSPSSRRTPRS